MRFALAMLTLLLGVSPKAVAKDLTNWSEVQKLRAGTEIRVVDHLGKRVEGYLTSVLPDELRLNGLITNQPGLSTPLCFLRPKVPRIYKLGKKYERHLSGRNLILSSTIGMVGGIAIGAAVDHAYPNAEDPGQGKLIGGVLGFFTGPAVLAIARAVASGLHRTKLIYRAPPDQINGTSHYDVYQIGTKNPCRFPVNFLNRAPNRHKVLCK